MLECGCPVNAGISVLRLTSTLTAPKLVQVSVKVVAKAQGFLPSCILCAALCSSPLSIQSLASLVTCTPDLPLTAAEAIGSCSCQSASEPLGWWRGQSSSTVYEWTQLRVGCPRASCLLWGQPTGGSGQEHRCGA